MHLGRYSMGIGDRFAQQGIAQLDAILQAQRHGVHVTPVWNKSHREHTIVGSRPEDVRAEADAAVAARGWRRPYFVDADHIGLATVDGFVAASDFFTLDVADAIGHPADADDLAAFVRRHERFVGRLEIPGIDRPLAVSEETIRSTAATFLRAVHEAGAIYRRIVALKGTDDFVTEVSMDETDRPQTPGELLFILAAVADEGIPAQTIAPRFSGRFNKGVDYVGDVGQFAREFEDDLAVIAFAVREFGSAGGPEAERPHRQRQVLDLRPDPPGAGEVRRGRTLEDGRHDVARGVDRPGHGRRRRSGDRQGSLPQRPGPIRRALRAVRLGDRHRSLRTSVGRGRGRAGTRRRSPRRCVTTRRARPTTPTSGNSCTSPTRSRPRWALATSTPWRNTPPWSPETSPRTCSSVTSAEYSWKADHSHTTPGEHEESE